MMSLGQQKPVVSRHERLRQNMVKQYPALGKIPFLITEGSGQGYAEVFPSDELHNPVPGKNVIQIREQGRGLPDEELGSLIAGEVLHFLGGKDYLGRPRNKEFRAFKDRFMKSLTADQVNFERRFHHNLVAGGQEKRSFEDFMEVSRADAYIRGYLFPDRNREFLQEGVFTKEQIDLLEEARQYLKGGKKGLK